MTRLPFHGAPCITAMIKVLKRKGSTEKEPFVSKELKCSNVVFRETEDGECVCSEEDAGKTQPQDKNTHCSLEVLSSFSPSLIGILNCIWYNIKV